MPCYDRPCASKGLTSYRYKGRYGWIMIGAHNDDDALREAKRSTDNVGIDNLQVWNEAQSSYRAVKTEKLDRWFAANRPLADKKEKPKGN